MIINIPSNLEKQTTHRYSKNSFKLHRLPIPRPGEVLGKYILFRNSMKNAEIVRLIYNNFAVKCLKGSHSQ